MSAAPTHFQASACNPAGTKKGAPAETGRAQIKADQMLNTISTTTNIRQGIGNTVTVLDDKETARQRREKEAAVQWFAERMLRGEVEVFSEMATITPALASVILHRNPDNRRIKIGKVAEFRSDLESNRWLVNGEPIIISKEGLLNDGQHRLIAIRDSGFSMKSLLVFGVARASRLTVDQGTMRTVADFLEMEGKPAEAVVVAAVARMIAQFEKDGSLKPRRGAFRAAGATKTEILGVAADNRFPIERSIAAARTKGFSTLGKLSTLAFAHFIISRRDRDAAATFFRKLYSGADINEGSALQTLRLRLTFDQAMKEPERFEAIVRAWNSDRGEGPLSKIMIMGRIPKIEG